MPRAQRVTPLDTVPEGTFVNRSDVTIYGIRASLEQCVYELNDCYIWQATLRIASGDAWVEPRVLRSARAVTVAQYRDLVSSIRTEFSDNVHNLLREDVTRRGAQAVREESDAHRARERERRRELEQAERLQEQAVPVEEQGYNLTVSRELLEDATEIDWLTALRSVNESLRNSQNRWSEAYSEVFARGVDSTRRDMRTMDSQQQDRPSDQGDTMPRRTRQTPVDRVGPTGRLQRRCRVCATWLTLTENTYRYDSRQDTYRTECRDCEREAMRQRAAVRRANGTVGSNSSRNARGRAFGVEIELVAPRKSVIVNALQAAGINVVTRGYAATNGSRWELKTDCSVNGEGLELVSPKLRGAAGFAELETVCNVLRSVGARVDRSTGIHVHVDFRRKSLEQIKHAIIPMIERQDTLWKYVAPSRRNNSYCPGWSSYHVEELRLTNNLRYLYIGPRGNVNLGAYSRHGSIEFRSHGGSTRYDRISAWVRFLLAAVEHNERSEGASLPTDPRALLQTVGLERRDVDVLMRFEDAAARAALAAQESVEDTEYQAVTV